MLEHKETHFNYRCSEQPPCWCTPPEGWCRIYWQPLLAASSSLLRGDIKRDLDGTLLVVLVGAVEVLLVVVRLLVVHPEPQRVQEDLVGLAALLDWWNPDSFGRKGDIWTWRHRNLNFVEQYTRLTCLSSSCRLKLFTFGRADTILYSNDLKDFLNVQLKYYQDWITLRSKPINLLSKLKPNLNTTLPNLNKVST